MYLQCCTQTPLGDGQFIQIAGPCIFTGKPVQITVKSCDLQAWLNGTLIQDAMPYLAAADREFLISGISAEGWELGFGPEPEPEDED